MSTRDNRSRYALLGALTLGPMSGYDIKKFLDGSVAHFWRESFGQIYPMLAELERDGLVRPLAAEGADVPRPGRPRRVLELTGEGRAALSTWIAEPPSAAVPRVEILLKLFFARHAGPPAVRRLVEAFHAEQVAMAQRYAGMAGSIAAAYGGHPDLPYWLLTLDYGARVGAAHVEWAEAALATLAE